jgi:hypothetical protein
MEKDIGLQAEVLRQCASTLRIRLDELNVKLDQRKQSFAFRKKVWLPQSEWPQDSLDQLQYQNEVVNHSGEFDIESLRPLSQGFDLRFADGFNNHQELLNHWVNQSIYLRSRVSYILKHPNDADNVKMLEAELGLRPSGDPGYTQSVESLVEQLKILFTEETKRLSEQNLQKSVLDEGYWETKYWPVDSLEEFEREEASLLNQLQESQKEFSAIPYEYRYLDDHYLITSHLCNVSESITEVTDVREVTLEQLKSISETFPQYRSYYYEKLARDQVKDRD